MIKSILLLLFVVTLLTGCGGEKATELSYEERREIKQEEFQNTHWRTDLDWNEMVRNADEYEGEYVKVEGLVLSVVDEGDYDLAQMFLNGDLDQPVMVAVHHSHINRTLVEEDWLTVRGSLNGIYEYETVASGHKRAPFVLSEIVDVKESY